MAALMRPRPGGSSTGTIPRTNPADENRASRPPILVVLREISSDAKKDSLLRYRTLRVPTHGSGGCPTRRSTIACFSRRCPGTCTGSPRTGRRASRPARQHPGTGSRWRYDAPCAYGQAMRRPPRRPGMPRPARCGHRRLLPPRPWAGAASAAPTPALDSSFFDPVGPRSLHRISRPHATVLTGSRHRTPRLC